MLCCLFVLVLWVHWTILALGDGLLGLQVFAYLVTNMKLCVLGEGDAWVLCMCCLCVYGVPHSITSCYVFILFSLLVRSKYVGLFVFKRSKLLSVMVR